MEKVKSESKNVHSKRALFFNVGLVVSLLLCFAAFEFKVYIADETVIDLPKEHTLVFLDDNNIKNTIHKPKPKPVIPTNKNKVFEITETKAVEASVEPKRAVIDISDMTELINSDGPAAETVIDPTIHDAVERQPQFEGGISKFYEYVANNIKYPRKEKALGIDGRVYLIFVIEVDGSISDVEVLKGVSEGLDKEAVRVLKEAPNWIPGANRGQPVRVRMRIPINFQLQ